MKLKDITIRQAKAKDKQYKLSDGGGMYLLVSPNGSKYFRMKYYLDKKEKIASLGVYPEVSLIEARAMQAKLKQDLARGINIAKTKKEAELREKGKYSFETVALEWLEKKKASLTEKYARGIKSRLERGIFPKLGYKDINKISSLQLLEVIKEVEARGAVDLAKRLLQICGQIFRYAIIIERVERDITADLKGALKSVKKGNYNRLKIEELPEFLKKLENYQGEELTKLAVKLIILTFVRTIELRGAKWQEFKIDKQEWHIPAERMKMKEKHIVPLSGQAIKIVEEIKELGFNSEYVFPNVQNIKGFMSENTMLYALYRMGYHSRATIHGFRAVASTILNEEGFNSDWVEAQLAHQERNKVRSSYNYAKYLSKRAEMMQWYSDYIENLQKKEK